MISYHANTAGSATMALVPIVLFFLVLTTKAVTTRAHTVVAAHPS